MDFQGYVDRIEFHFERLGVSDRPTKQQYIDAWNNQIPAKKMAQAFARRQQRKTRTDRETTWTGSRVIPSNSRNIEDVVSDAGLDWNAPGGDDELPRSNSQ